MSNAPLAPAKPAAHAKGSTTPTVMLPVLVFLLLISGCVSSPAAQAGSLKLLISTRGMYRLTRAELQKAGLPIGRDSLDKLRLTHRGREVPVDVPPGGQNDTLVFFADPEYSPYTASDVYWLTVGEAGTRMPTRQVQTGTGGAGADSFAATLTLEQDKMYVPEGIGDSHWFWKALTAPSVFTMTARLDAVARPEGQLALTIAGQTTGPHRLAVSVNDQPAGEARWDGRNVFRFESPVNSYKSGDNVIRLQSQATPGIVEVDLVDSAVLTYTHALRAVNNTLEFAAAGNVSISGWSSGDLAVYDVTDPERPVRLTGWQTQKQGEVTALAFADPEGSRRYIALAADRYMTASPVGVPAGRADLKATGQRADELIIAPAQFAAGLEPLVKYRAAQGLAVKVVGSELVFDTFSDGIPDPHALRDFIRYAREKWDKPAPRFILLVGKASYDYRDSLKAPNRNLLPTMLVPTPHLGEAGSDNWLVAKSDDDPRPIEAIGRIPAKDPAELGAAIDKIKSYEAQDPAAGWKRRITVVTDNKESGFDVFASNLVEMTPSTVAANKVFLSAYGGDIDRTRAEIERQWNAGSLLMTYIGHGSIDTWAMGPLFSAENLGALNNGNRLPILITPTCLDGYYYHPEKDSLAEQLLFKADGGIAAGLVPTGLSLPESQEVLMKELWKQLFGQPATLGEVILRAKQAVPVDDENVREVIETFTLLGDPATRWTPPP